MYVCGFNYYVEDGNVTAGKNEVMSTEYEVCYFESSSGFNTVNVSSEKTSSYISVDGGKKFYTVGENYDNPFEFSIGFCRTDGLPFGLNEYKNILSMLEYISNNNGNLSIYTSNPNKNYDYVGVKSNANVVTVGANIVGVKIVFTSESNMLTKKPSEVFFITPGGLDYSGPINSSSDEYSFYPDVTTITCTKDGDCEINMEGEYSVVFYGCKADEIIEINCKDWTIKSTEDGVMNRWNYVFPKLFGTKAHNISFKNCLVRFSYTPKARMVIS